MLLALHDAILRLVALLGMGGPWVYFIAMAVLPGLGMPMLAFTLTAGPVFGQSLGMGGVVAAGIAAATANFMLTYALARGALRPWLERLLVRLGHRLPQAGEGDMTDLIVVVRVTPGIPFCVQNYLLGLANAPAGKYLVISCLAVWSYTAGFILFGDALLHGRGNRIVVAVSVLVAAFAVTHWARRHFGARKAADAGAR